MGVWLALPPIAAATGVAVWLILTGLLAVVGDIDRDDLDGE